MEEFRNAIDDCELRAINPVGEQVTWYDTREGIKVWERLDRYLCNPEFESLIKDVKASNLDWVFSVHQPIEANLEVDKNK